MNVVVDHVTKTIHGAVVLQDISLNFESGKVYGLQGENGSGKTMLLRLMCGLIYATEGSVSVNDRRLGKDLDFPESVGVMIESPAFIDEYTGQKNLELLAGLKQLISASDIHNTLQAVGLDPNDKRTFKKYSLGMACGFFACYGGERHAKEDRTKGHAEYPAGAGAANTHFGYSPLQESPVQGGGRCTHAGDRRQHYAVRCAQSHHHPTRPRRRL